MVKKLTPPSGPNISADGRLVRPAYLAPVRPAKGLFAVPAAILVGIWGAVGVEEDADDEAGAGVGLLAALLTR